mmetsp:Transcript_14775/g.35235  ORF Transcript_14775/g.35235 Transcript_14775/m.35235 type:complete len:212 (+) Transcript_14775:64-699(+)
MSSVSSDEASSVAFAGLRAFPTEYVSILFHDIVKLQSAAGNELPSVVLIPASTLTNTLSPGMNATFGVKYTVRLSLSNRVPPSWSPDTSPCTAILSLMLSLSTFSFVLKATVVYGETRTALGKGWLYVNGVSFLKVSRFIEGSGIFRSSSSPAFGGPAVGLMPMALSWLRSCSVFCCRTSSSVIALVFPKRRRRIHNLSNKRGAIVDKNYR